MDSNGRYTFHNFTDTLFEGRFGGVPYVFAPGETKEYDPDKHYMLIVLSKQLADRELAKGVKGVLRTKEAGNDYGKAIDANGNLYKPSIEMRKELMVRAIGELANKPIPYPEIQGDATEAGATLKTTENIATLQEQVKQLTEIVSSLTNKIGEQAIMSQAVPVAPVGNGHTEDTKTEVSSTGLTKDVLTKLASERGLIVTPEMTKEEIIRSLNQPIHPMGTA